MRKITEDEVLFEKTDEDLMLISIAFSDLTQDNVHNRYILNQKLVEVESKNKKLEEENINLKDEVNKKRKVDAHLNSFKEIILVKQ